MLGGASHWGIFGDCTQGPRQRRPKLSRSFFSSSPNPACRSRRRRGSIMSRASEEGQGQSHPLKIWDRRLGQEVL